MPDLGFVVFGLAGTVLLATGQFVPGCICIGIAAWLFDRYSSRFTACGVGLLA